MSTLTQDQILECSGLAKAWLESFVKLGDQVVTNFSCGLCRNLMEHLNTNVDYLDHRTVDMFSYFLVIELASTWGNKEYTGCSGDPIPYECNEGNYEGSTLKLRQDLARHLLKGLEDYTISLSE